MRPRLDQPLYSSVCVGLASAAVAAFFVAGDYAETLGWPVEHAEVVAVEDHGDVFSVCGSRQQRRPRY